jgi:hypothetical protein
MTRWHVIRTVMLGYPHARAVGDDEIQIAFTHVEVGIGLRVLHRDPVVVLIAELAPVRTFAPLEALRFNMIAAQRIGVIEDRYVLRDELTGTEPDVIGRQVTAFVRTAAAIRRRGRRVEVGPFAYAL